MDIRFLFAYPFCSSPALLSRLAKPVRQTEPQLQEAARCKNDIKHYKRFKAEKIEKNRVK